MKKFSLVMAFLVVFLLGLIVGAGTMKAINAKQNKQQVLATDTETNIDFSTSIDEEEQTEAVTDVPQTTEAQPVTEVSTEENQDDDENSEEGEVDDREYTGTFDKDAAAKLEEQRKALYGKGYSYQNTMDIAAIDEKIVALNTYNFSNKKIAFLGDSITLGYGGDVVGQEKYFGFDDYMQEMLNIGEVVNVGSGGSTISKDNEDSCFERRAKDKIDEDVDIIIVMGGINDYITGRENFGDMDHLNYGDTYCGSVDTLFYTLDNRWNAEVFVVTPYGLEMEKEAEAKRITFEEYVDVQRSLYDKYGLHLFDMYSTGFLNTNDSTIKAKLSADGTHLNNDGYKLLGQHIAADLVEYYGNKQ